MLCRKFLRSALLALAFLALCTLTGSAQSDRALEIRAINAQILTESAEASAGRPDKYQDPALRAVRMRRSALLRALAAENPDEALRAALPPGLAKRVAEQFGQDGLESYGSISGLLELEVEDGDIDAPFTREFAFMRNAGKRYRIHLAKAARRDLEAGSMYQAEGFMLDNADLVTEDLQPISADAPGGCTTLGEQKIAVIKVRPPGHTVRYNSQTLHDRMFGTGRSASEFWREMSYGKMWAVGDVYPSGDDAWYTLDREYSCNESSQLRNKALDLAGADVDFTQYTRTMIVFPKPSDGCVFAGRASIGCWVSNPDGGSSISYALLVSNSMASTEKVVQLVTHEGGHNLGLSHAASLQFGTEPLGAPTDTGTRSNYNDRYSTMGLWDSGHVALPHKQFLKWITMVDQAPLETAYNTVLEPYSFDTDGEVGLGVRRPGTDDWLYLEHRRRSGQYFSTAVTDPSAGVLIHLIKGNSVTGTYTNLLNFGPGAFNDADLVGRWDDPYSTLAINAGPATPEGLPVSLTYGSDPDCTPMLPTVSVTPVNSSTEFGGFTSYTLSVRNNDIGSSCAMETWTLDTIHSPDLAISGPSQTNVVPGLQTNSQFTITPVTPQTGPITYDLSFLVGRPQDDTTISATLTVVPPVRCVPSAPTLSLAPSTVSETYPTPGSFTATITNNDSDVCDPGTFLLSATSADSGYNVNIGTPTQTLAPGASGTSTYSVQRTDPAPAADQTFNLVAVSTRGAERVTANATFNILAPCLSAAPSLTLLPRSATLQFPGSQTFTLGITNNDSPPCGAESFTVSAVGSVDPGGTGTVTASVSDPNVNLEPGAAGTTQVVVATGDEPDATSTFTVTATVSRSDGSTVAADISGTVDPPAEVGKLEISLYKGRGANGAVYIEELELECKGSCDVESATWPLTIRATPRGQSRVEFQGCEVSGNSCTVSEAGAIIVRFVR